MSEKHYGLYKGVIIDNSDPTKSGRVKIWVPQVHGTGTADDPYSEPTESAIIGLSPKNLAWFKESLPWSSVGQSMFGSGGSGGVDMLTNEAQSPRGTNGDGDLLNFSGRLPVIGKNKKGNPVIDPEALRRFAIKAVSGSQLSGVTPVDGATYGIDGSAESWADFLVELCQVESGFETNNEGDFQLDPSGNKIIGKDGRAKGRHGTDSELSLGLFQLSASDATNNGISDTKFTDEQLFDPAKNTRYAIQIIAKRLASEKRISDGNGNGVSKYWGTLKKGGSLYHKNTRRTTSTSVQQTTSTTRYVQGESSPNQPRAITTQKASASYLQTTVVPVKSVSRDDLGGGDGCRKLGTPISLDFNDAGGSAGILIVVPDNISPTDRNLAMEWVNATSAFFRRYAPNTKSSHISSNPIRTTTSNGGGMKGFYHTEPFDNDTPAMNAIRDHAAEYAAILMGTLGKIPNAFFLPPHTKSAQGAEHKWNGVSTSERQFALDHIIPALQRMKGTAIKDRFTSVGVGLHPEEVSDKALLISVGSESAAEDIIKNGKALFEARRLASRTPQMPDQRDNITTLEQGRTKLWDDVLSDVSVDDKKKVSAYVSAGLDYTDIPLASSASPFSTAYGTDSYSNSAKGSFTIPNNGASVWTMFEGGSPHAPVALALNPSAGDYSSVYNAADLPDGSPETIGEKSVINTRGGSLEINGSSGNQSVNLASATGSSILMHKGGTSIFSPLDYSSLALGDKWATVEGNHTSYAGGDTEQIMMGNHTRFCGDVSAAQRYTEELKTILKPLSERLGTFGVQRCDQPHEEDGSPLQTKVGTPAKCPVCKGAGTPTTSNKPATFLPATASAGSSTTESLNGAVTDQDVKTQNTETCSTCDGTGSSPSSLGGDYMPDQSRASIPSTLAMASPKINEAETNLGEGGVDIEYVTKSKTVLIGGVMNDLTSIKLDPKGGLAMSGVQASSSGETTSVVMEPVPHLESTPVPSIGGGDYFMKAANKWQVAVGSNGATLQTLGPLTLQGRLTALFGDQINISSKNSIKLHGGKHLHISADTVTISGNTTTKSGKTYRNIALDGTVGVSGNLTIKGGMHVEGPITCQHITAVKEYHRTETTVSNGYAIPNIHISNSFLPSQTLPVVGGKGSVTIPAQNLVSTTVAGPASIVSAHSHSFGMAPMTLLPTNDDVRKAGNAMAQATPVLAKMVNDSLLPKLDKLISLIMFFDPTLFGLIADCNTTDDDFQNLIDDIMHENITPEEARKRFTRSSESPLSPSYNSGAGCDVCFDDE